LVSRTPAVTAGDIEMQSEWAKYICVQIAGYVENIVRELYSDFVSNKAHPSVSAYAQHHLEGVQNPKAERLVKIAKAFSQGWGQSLEQYLDDNGRGEAVDAIMNNRHLIAHGRPSGISLARVKEYLLKVDEIAEYISHSLEKGI
jgi:hypothetical protein